MTPHHHATVNNPITSNASPFVTPLTPFSVMRDSTLLNNTMGTSASDANVTHRSLYALANTAPGTVWNFQVPPPVNDKYRPPRDRLPFYGKHDPSAAKRASHEAQDPRVNYVIDWIGNVDLAFFSVAYSDEWTKTSYALTQLQGNAANYWRGVIGRDHGSKSLPWNEFKKLMVARFYNDAAEVQSITDFFHSFKQGSRENLSSAVDRFSQWVHKALALPDEHQYALAMNDGYLVHQLRQGMHPAARRMLELRAPASARPTLAEVLQICPTLYHSFDKPQSSLEGAGRMDGDSDEAMANITEAEVQAYAAEVRAQAGPHTICFKCQQPGHFAHQCPSQPPARESARERQVEINGRPRSVDDRRPSRGYDRPTGFGRAREDKRRTREREPRWRPRGRRFDESRSRRDFRRRPRESSVNAARAHTASRAHRSKRQRAGSRGRSPTLAPHTSESEWAYSDEYTEEFSSDYSSEESSGSYDSPRDGHASAHAATGVESAPSHRAPAPRDSPPARQRGAGAEPRPRRTREADEDDGANDPSVPRVHHVASRRVPKNV